MCSVPESDYVFNEIDLQREYQLPNPIVACSDLLGWVGGLNLGVSMCCPLQLSAENDFESVGWADVSIDTVAGCTSPSCQSVLRFRVGDANISVSFNAMELVVVSKVHSRWQNSQNN